MIPASARPATYSLLVADGPALAALEQREMRQRSCPGTSTSWCAPSTGCAATTTSTRACSAPDEGAIVGGEYLQSLPPSVLSVLGGSSEGGAVVPIRTAAVWDYDLPTDYAVSGSRVLTLTVER